MITIVIVVFIATTVNTIGEICCGSQPFCADICEVAFLMIQQDAQTQNDGFSYQVSFDCTKQCATQDCVKSTTAHIHMLARKNPSEVTHF